MQVSNVGKDVRCGNDRSAPPLSHYPPGQWGGKKVRDCLYAILLNSYPRDVGRRINTQDGHATLPEAHKQHPDIAAYVNDKRARFQAESPAHVLSQPEIVVAGGLRDGCLVYVVLLVKR